MRTISRGCEVQLNPKKSRNENGKGKITEAAAASKGQENKRDREGAP